MGYLENIFYHVGYLENIDKLKQKDKNLPEFITQRQILGCLPDLFLYAHIDHCRA